jgi:hypothetical protein
MLTVKFTDIEEWLGELIAWKEEIEHKLVRLTTVRRTDPNLFIVTFVLRGGAVMRGSLVCLEKYMGSGMILGQAYDQAGDLAIKRLNAAITEVTDRLLAHDLDVRGGWFEADKE